MSARLEVITFRRGHFHVRILEAECNHIVRRRRHNYYRAARLQFRPAPSLQDVNQRHRLIQQTLIRHRQ